MYAIGIPNITFWSAYFEKTLPLSICSRSFYFQFFVFRDACHNETGAQESQFKPKSVEVEGSQSQSIRSEEKPLLLFSRDKDHVNGNYSAN